MRYEWTLILTVFYGDGVACSMHGFYTKEAAEAAATTHANALKESGQRFHMTASIVRMA